MQGDNKNTGAIVSFYHKQQQKAPKCTCRFARKMLTISVGPDPHISEGSHPDLSHLAHWHFTPCSGPLVFGLSIVLLQNHGRSQDFVRGSVGAELRAEGQQQGIYVLDI